MKNYRFHSLLLLRQQRWMKMLTRNLAVELGPQGITINNVAPGRSQPY